jgi:hypothetical protein
MAPTLITCWINLMVSYARSLHTGSTEQQKRVVLFHSQLAEKKAGIKPYLKKFL